MTTSILLPTTIEEVKQASVNNGEPAWLTESRVQGLTLANELQLPKLEKTKLERWDLSAYGALQQGALEQLSEVPAEAAALVDQDQHNNLVVFRNSGSVYATLSDELSAQGVIFTDLQSAVKNHPELIQKYLHSAVKADENALTALHSALWHGGVFLYVPKNVEISVPLQSIFILDDNAKGFAPHVLVVAEANSAVTYVDNYISTGINNKIVHPGVAEIFAGAGAKVQFATVHQLDVNVTDLTYRRAIIENDGSIEWIVGEMNNGDAMSETLSVLNGNGSTSDAKIIAVGSGSQRMNYTTKAIHFGKSSDSQMITRAVMREEATAIINGITKIEKGATKANGEQTEKVLMLSPKARGDANPILLIDEDDVTAGHAASVGRVNAEQVYYLMSRGISRADAERLIIYGFLAPVVSDIPLEQLQKQLQGLIEGKLS